MIPLPTDDNPVVIIHGDCLEILPQIPAGVVDMLWTDPPYGHSNHDGDFNARLNDRRGIENKPIENDDMESMRRVMDRMLSEAVRVLKPDCCCCCCCCGGGPKPTFAWVANRMDSNGLSFFHSVIWDKVNPGLGWRYRRQHEMVMVAHVKGGRLKWNEEVKAVPNIIRIYPPRNRKHPNEKPLSLVSSFINQHTLPGDLILDPFAGSGTTGVAAILEGRKAILIEKDAGYVEVIKKRIAETLGRRTTLANGKVVGVNLFENIL